MPHTLTDGCATVALGCVQTGQSIDTLVRVCVPKGETRCYRVKGTEKGVAEVEGAAVSAK